MPTVLQTLEPRRLFAAGDPLETFGHHGQAFTPYELYEATLSEVKATPSGKLLAGVASQFYRDTRPGEQADFVRFNADGSPDLDFGTAGHVDSFFTSVRRVSVLPDGKFYALGTTTVPAPGRYGASTRVVAGVDDWFVARFHSSGKLDRSFGTRGRVAIHLERSVREYGSSYERGNGSSFLDADGRLTLLAGYQPDANSDTEPAVFRYDATGHFDTTFNGGQPLRLKSAADEFSDPSMAVSADGDMAVIATRTFRRRASTVVKRFDADGSVVGTFGNNGLATVAKSATSTPSIALASDGSVFAAGNQFWRDELDEYQSAKHVYKLDANGRSNAAFSGGSVLLGLFAGADALLPTADGGVILGGGRAMQRFGANGTSDAAFGTVDNSSRMPVIANDTIYAITTSAAYQVNRRGVAVYRHALTAVSLGGNGVSPVAVTGKNLTLTGTSDSENIEISALGAFAAPSVGVQLTITRGFWSRTFPASAVQSITAYGEGGNDDIRAFMDGVTGVSVKLYGGSGNDGLAGYGSNILAYGGPGEDTVWGDISVDRDFQ